MRSNSVLFFKCDSVWGIAPFLTLHFELVLKCSCFRCNSIWRTRILSNYHYNTLGAWIPTVEYWTQLVFKWIKPVQLTNGLVFKYSSKSKKPDHSLSEHLNMQWLHFEWSKPFIAIAMVPTIPKQTIQKCLVFKWVLCSNIQYSSPTV